MSSETFKSIFRPGGIAVWVPPTAAEPLPLLAENILAAGYQGRVALLGPGPDPPAPLMRCPDPGQLSPGLELLLFKGDVSELARRMPSLGKAGIRAAIVYSPPPPDDFWRETLLPAARRAKVRLIGPGSWGVVNTAVGLAAVPDRLDLNPGGLALVTQGRVVSCYFLAEAAKRGVGLGLALDLGAEGDLGQDEVVDHLAHHYQAGALALHLGRVKRPAAFVSAALAAARQKPVLALKAWEDPGPCHTAEPVRFPAPTQEEAWDAVLRRAGVARMESMDSLLGAADLAARLGNCPGPRVLAVSESMGAAGMALDAMNRHGLTPAQLDETALHSLAELGCRATGRPGLALLPPDPGQETLRAAAEVCLRANGVDALIAVPDPDPERDAAGFALALAQAQAECRAGETCLPVLFVRAAGTGLAGDVAHANGLVFFESPERAVEAYAGLWGYCRAIRLAEEIPRRPLGRFRFDLATAGRLLAEAEDKGGGLRITERLELLKAFGLPVLPAREVASAGELEQACETWGYPSRLVPVPESQKENGPGSGLSWIVRSRRLAASQWRAAGRHIAKSGFPAGRFLAQPFFRPAHPSLMMGWHGHPELGPLVFFGEGGHKPHALRERTWCPAPLNRAQARAMMERTGVFAEATRSGNPERVWPSLLEEMLIKLARMAQELPGIRNLALDPVLINDGMAWIPDAAIEIAGEAGPHDCGLVVPPYPDQQEAGAVCAGGVEVLLRPVRAEDADLVRELFSRLSPESVHSRFFRDIPELTRRMLVSLTQIDYGREIALAAVLADRMDEKLLGLCSLAARPGSEWSEFSVVVRDSWQRKGIGRLLMTRMAEIARAQGRLKIMGLVQRYNRAMIQLGRELGFSVGPPSEDLVELRWELDPDDAPPEPGTEPRSG